MSSTGSTGGTGSAEVGPGVEIRWATAETVRASLAPLSAAFGETITDAEMDEALRVWETARIIAAWDGPMAVATAGNLSFTLTVPGAQVPAGGVSLVGVIPTHRRRGILTSMMRTLFDDSARRGEAVSMLWASESAIYQRYGYGLATLTARLQATRGRPGMPEPDPHGTRFRLVTADEAAALMPPVYERLRPTIPGMLSRSPEFWRWEMLGDSESRSRTHGPKFLVVCEVDGALAGYAVYRLKAEWDGGDPRGTVTAFDVVGVSPRAERALWAWLMRLDLFPRLQAIGQPVPHPLQLIVAEPRALGMTVSDGLWLRLLDVPAALAARRYSAAAHLVIDVRDHFLPANAGRYVLTAGADGSARVERTTAEADLALEVNDLAAMYLGGFRASELARAGRVEERRAGGLRLADAMFASACTPFCGTEF